MKLTIVDRPSATLLGPPNADVFAYLAGLSAHSDIVTPLLAAVEPLPGVEAHCANRERFGYVVAWVAGRVFAFAAGMQGVALRLPLAEAATARTRGGSAIEGLGPDWVQLPLFGDGGLSAELNDYAQRAFAYAQVPASAAKPAPGNGIADDPLHLPVVAVIVFLLAVWGSSFSHSCTSDGCIGIVIPVGGALLAMAAQIFVLIPAYAIKRSQAGKPVVARVGLWIAVSAAAFMLPMVFAKI
jgi:hypothetical protein